MIKKVLFKQYFKIELSSFDSAFKFNEQKSLHDVTFEWARLDEKVITSFFSSALCQLACGTSTGTIQLYEPERRVTETIDAASGDSNGRRKRKYQRE